MCSSVTTLALHFFSRLPGAENVLADLIAAPNKEILLPLLTSLTVNLEQNSQTNEQLLKVVESRWHILYVQAARLTDVHVRLTQSGSPECLKAIVDSLAAFQSEGLHVSVVSYPVPFYGQSHNTCSCSFSNAENCPGPYRKHL